MLSVPHVHGFYPNLQSTLPFLTCSCSSRTPKCAFDDSMVQRFPDRLVGGSQPDFYCRACAASVA